MVMTGGCFSWHWVYHITIHGNMFGILYMHMELWYHNWTYHFDMNGGFISSWEWTMKWPSSFWMPKKLMSSPLTMEHLIITRPWVIFFNVHVGWKTNIFFEHGFKMWLPVVTSFLVAVLSPPIFTGAFWFGPGILVVKGCEMGQDWGTPPSVFSIGNRVLDVGWPPRGLASSSGVWIYMIYMEEARDIMDSFFPECVARVPVSLWGSGGWGCVRSTLRSRAQPFATVRNRSRDPRMAVPMGSSAEVVLFGGFRRLVASFRVAGVALRDIQTCSATCRKSFCVAGAILLRRFQKMCCSFRGRRSTLGVSIVIFRGRRSTLDVSFCVFFVNRIGRAASSGDKVQIPWQAWHFLTCVENWRKPRTKHRFWGYKFSGSKENS